jgi:hypothetical protein
MTGSAKQSSVTLEPWITSSLSYEQDINCRLLFLSPLAFLTRSARPDAKMLLLFVAGSELNNPAPTRVVLRGFAPGNDSAL